jgi:SAM-dependent methyltransferase
VDQHVPRLIGLWRARFSSGAAAPGGSRSLPDGRLTGPELYEAAAAVKELSRGFTRERELAGARYMDDPGRLGGYLLFYWTVSFAQTWAALLSAGIVPPAGLEGRRVLDLGAGPGASSLALLAAGAGRVTAVDRSVRALEVAGELARRSGRRLETRVADLASGAPLPEGPFDLVTAVHTVNELWSDRDDRLERRRKLVEGLADRLAPGGRILLVDPALTATANQAIELRDALAAGGWRVLSPCTRGDRCPALPSGTCHADVAWEPPPAVRRIGHAARIGRESLAFSYFLLEPPPASGGPDAAATASAGARPTGGLPLYRVVSERFLAKSGRLRVLLCGPAGRFPLSVDGRASFPSARVFRSLERYDLVRVEAVEQRATGWGLVPESVLDVAARAPSLEAPGESTRRYTDRQYRPLGGAPVTRRATDGRARGLPHHRR